MFTVAAVRRNNPEEISCYNNVRFLITAIYWSPGGITAQK